MPGSDLINLPVTFTHQITTHVCVQAPNFVGTKSFANQSSSTKTISDLSGMPWKALSPRYIITLGTADRSSRGCGSFQRPGPQELGDSKATLLQKITASLTAPQPQEGVSHSSCLGASLKPLTTRGCIKPQCVKRTYSSKPPAASSRPQRRPS